MNAPVKKNTLILPSTSKIGDIIAQMESHNLRYAVIVDENNTYHGTVELNELRRYLLGGANETSPIQEFDLTQICVPLQAIYDKKAVTTIFEELRAEGNYCLSVIDLDHKLADIITIDEIRGKDHPNGAFSSNARVLVIGGAGYLGSILSQRLLEKNYKVRILDSFIYGRKPIEAIETHPNLEIYEGDIRNIELVVRSLYDVDSVILLAAVVGDPASQARPSQTIQTNYIATQAIATACKLANINRLIYASTCSVYGVGQKLLDEESPLNPVSLYARTKIASENAILSMVNGNFAPTIMRMSTLYGYSPRMRFDLVVNTMTMKAFLENQITVFGGNQWRPLLHVADAAEAFIHVLEADINLVKNKIYNVGSKTQNYRIGELSHIISDALGGIRIRIENTQLDARDYQVSFAKIEQDLHFEVQHTVKEASLEIFDKLKSKVIADPSKKVYYNHFFDASEEK